MYDSNSHVSHNPYEHSRVDTGSKNTNYTWVVDNTTTIEVTWKKRFRNALHDHNKWLNEISESHGIAEAYDDYTGIRNVTHIKNVYGEKFFIKNESYIYNFQKKLVFQRCTSAKEIEINDFLQDVLTSE